MALTNVTLETFEFGYRVVGSTAAHVDLGDAWIIGYEPDHLEKLAETLLEAARDLRIIQVRELEAKAEADRSAA